MAATATIRLLADVLGLGEDKKFASLFTDTTAPTEASGPIYVVPAVTTQVDVELGGLGPTELRGVVIRCASGIMLAAPASSAAVTAGCYLSAGQAVYFSHQPLITAAPAVIPFTTTTAYEVLSFGVAS